MSMGERIKACRQRAGMSQEKVAELVGVSRQAVTKWEMNRSAPSTENLFKLADIFDTTVDMLLAPEERAQGFTAEQISCLFRQETERNAAVQRQRRWRSFRNFLWIVAGYVGIYFLGRMIWCDRAQSSLMGWLFIARPSGEHSYLYGWLLSSHLFWYAMGISAFPACFGKEQFSRVTLLGFAVGLVLGILFGPDSEAAAWGRGDNGWLIWGVVYLMSILAGLLAELFKKRTRNT